MDGKSVITLFLSLLVAVSASASVPRYDKIDINTRNVYTLNSFPYQKYFVCIAKSEPVLSSYIASDRLYRQAIATTTGEVAATFYRYFNGLPEKENFRTPTTQSLRPTKEQVPFYNGRVYSYPHTYIDRRKRDYQYDMKAYRLLKQQWNRGGDNRHWVQIRITFYQRVSDYELKNLTLIDNLMIMVSVDMDKIRQATSEQDAYQVGYNNPMLYYFAASSSDCK